MFIELNRMRDGRPILVNTDAVLTVMSYEPGDERGNKMADEFCRAVVFTELDCTHVRNTYEEIREMLCRKETKKRAKSSIPKLPKMDDETIVRMLLSEDKEDE